MQFLEKLWKMCENIDVKLATTERRKNCLVSEPIFFKVFKRKFVRYGNGKKRDTYE